MASIFSRIVAGELPAYKVAEDDQHLAFLDITPLVEGHTLVIPKRETDYIFDLPAEELAALHLFAQRVAKGVASAVPCKRVGVAVIGLEVPHAHIHLIPMNKVADMNFANPKIKVAEARMQELAAAIAAQVPAATEGAAEQRINQDSNESVASQANSFAAPNGVAQQMQQQVEGLVYMSESEAPLVPVSYTAPGGKLTDAALLTLLGEPSDAPIETQELTLFLRTHTTDVGGRGDASQASRFKALQLFMKQELQDPRVYRVGKAPQIRVYALGKTEDGQLTGFKTVLTET